AGPAGLPRCRRVNDPSIRGGAMGGQTMSTVMSGMLWVLAAGPPAQRGRHGPDPVILILALVCVLVVVIPLCLWFSSFALRLSVSMTNKLLGGRHPTDFDYYYKRDPYARYDYIHRLRSRAGQLIPEPTNKEALLIVFLAGVINTAIQFGIGFAAGFLNESCDSLHYEPLVVKIAVVVITVPTTYVIESLI